MLLVKGPYFGNHGFRLSLGTNTTIKMDPYVGKKIVFNQMIGNTCIIFAKKKKSALNFYREFTNSLRISTKT